MAALLNAGSLNKLDQPISEENLGFDNCIDPDHDYHGMVVRTQLMCNLGNHYNLFGYTVWCMGSNAMLCCIGWNVDIFHKTQRCFS